MKKKLWNSLLSDFKYYFSAFGVINTITNLGFWSLIVYRFGYFMYGKIIFKLFLFYYFYIFLKYILMTLSKIELPPSCNIGSKINFVHPHGLVMGNKIKMGDKITIGPWVVIGHNGEKAKQPVLGNNIYIGAHACILGDVKIGDNVVIGVNTVITKDVPSNSIVTAPFKIKPNNSKSSWYEYPSNHR